MALITLTTDWSKSDYYIGSVKGKILSFDQKSVIVDISHHVQPFNVMQAAFILRNCYFEFPENSIHLIGVNSVLTEKRSLLLIEHNKHFFLCSDSGFPDLLFPEENPTVYSFQVSDNKADTFSSLNLFTEILFKLIKGEKPVAFAKKTEKYIHQIPLLPTIDDKLINGSVIYLDSYSNAITNINKELFERVGGNLAFEIFIQSNHYKIETISKTYAQSDPGDLLAIFNSIGLLEIAINNGKASELLSLSINSPIRVKFGVKQKMEELKLSGE